MMLIGVKKSDGWLFSEWRLTYRVCWDNICKAVFALYDSFVNPEILIDNSATSIKNKQDILSFEESATLMIRGLSDIIHVPVMITFNNQTNIVKAVVGASTEEFSKTDYKSFNLSICQFMDSIELVMYR